MQEDSVAPILVFITRAGDGNIKIRLNKGKKLHHMRQMDTTETTSISMAYMHSDLIVLKNCLFIKGVNTKSQLIMTKLYMKVESLFSVQHDMEMCQLKPKLPKHLHTRYTHGQINKPLPNC